MKRSNIEIIQNKREYSVYCPTLAAGATVETEMEARGLAEKWSDILGQKGYDEVTVYVYRDDGTITK